MSPENDCPHGVDAGAHVLKALPRDEHLAYVEHLTECASCRSEVEALRPVVDTMLIAAPQYAPPVALKSRIMAVVNAEAELLASAGAGADRPPRAEPARRRFRLPGFAAPLRPAFAGALACALLGLGVVGGVLSQQGGSDAPRVAEGRVVASIGKARLMQTGDKATLELTGMPSPPKGQVYQVWFDKGDGRFRPTHTLFNVRSDGRAKVAIEEPVKGVQKIAVTAERSGGALEPSSAPVITAFPA